MRKISSLRRWSAILIWSMQPFHMAVRFCWSACQTLPANEIFSPDGAKDQAYEAVCRGLLHLKEQAGHVCVVTNEIFSDAVVLDGDMDSYLEYLGKINQAAAQRADEVVEVIYGIPVFHKSADTCSNLCK